MSLHGADSLIVETDTAAESLPDPTTVTNRTHKLVNTGSATVTWSSTGATPFTENTVNVATITIGPGLTKDVRSNGTRWVVTSVATATNLGTLTLSPGSAIFPDGSGSNLAPQLSVTKSTAVAPTPYFYQLNFDAAQIEQCMWQFTMPLDYGSDPTLRVGFKMTSAVTGDVVFDVRVFALTPGDATDMDAKAFGSANNYTRAVAGTLGDVVNVDMAVTNADSVAAGDVVVLYFARLGDNGSDTAAGDCEVVSAYLEYKKA